MAIATAESLRVVKPWKKTNRMATNSLTRGARERRRIGAQQNQFKVQPILRQIANFSRLSYSLPSFCVAETLPSFHHSLGALHTEWFRCKLHEALAAIIRFFVCSVHFLYSFTYSISAGRRPESTTLAAAAMTSQTIRMVVVGFGDLSARMFGFARRRRDSRSMQEPSFLWLNAALSTRIGDVK